MTPENPSLNTKGKRTKSNYRLEESPVRAADISMVVLQVVLLKPLLVTLEAGALRILFHIEGQEGHR